jgi:ankyrin repeat protein
VDQCADAVAGQLRRTLNEVWLSAARWLLRRGISLQIRQWTGETPLHAAARLGAETATLEALLAAGQSQTADWLRAKGGREV